MPNQPKTPTRSIRIEDQLWEASLARAAARGETVSDVVREALAHYVRGQAPTRGRGRGTKP